MVHYLFKSFISELVGTRSYVLSDLRQGEKEDEYAVFYCLFESAFNLYMSFTARPISQDYKLLWKISFPNRERRKETIEGEKTRTPVFGRHLCLFCIHSNLPVVK